jgi:F0F1-type ATP synthase assembly protein I
MSSATGTASNPLTTRLEGPAPAMEVALDLVKRSLWVLPLVVGLGFAGWRVDGALSAAYGLAIVAVNFFLAAWILQVTGRVSFALMAGGALFGFLLRLGLIMAAVLLVKDQSWVELIPLGVTLIVTHLGLLFWELRYVSGSLAFPGLKPSPVPEPSQS